MRVLIQPGPFRDAPFSFNDRGKFPAKWITHPHSRAAKPIVMAFRLKLKLATPLSTMVHVSADERYELFIDGQRVGRGPERCDRANWAYESHQIDLPSGEHVIAARVFAMADLAPGAQISVEPAFLFCANDPALRELLSTGYANWEVVELEGVKFLPAHMMFYAGGRVRIDGATFGFGFESGSCAGYVSPRIIGDAYNDDHQTDQPPYRWLLTPATLPPMLEVESTFGIARHAQVIDAIPDRPNVVDPARRDPALIESWSKLLQGESSLTIPANTTQRVIVDLQDYVCGYPQITLSGGAGAIVRLHWAESLFEHPNVADLKGWWSYRVKGNRDAIDNKFFNGNGDEFLTAGGSNKRFDTLWWSAGRYVEIVVKTALQPLTIDSISINQTHFPYDWKGSFDSSEPRLAEVIPLGKRVMEMCSHETFMDCPYYEQLMYVGDTRLEALVSHTWNTDDRLTRKAIRVFGQSRKPPGFTQSRYPCRIEQVIPPFSAWWVAMVHDYLMWRDDAAFVRSQLSDVRGVIDAFMKFRNADGLIEAPLGWNYIDWVPHAPWKDGIPKNGDRGVSGILNLKLAWVLKQAAEIEDAVGELEIAQLQRRRSSELAATCVERFWNESRGLLADDLDQSAYSEHAQCMAILGDILPTPKRDRVINGLLNETDLARCTVYFRHYLFETFRVMNRPDAILDRMQLWYDLKAMGFKTTIEAPEPSRSDCHAWGAHPLFHMLATILGIRPASVGFKAVEIRPQLGSLTHAAGTMCHPRGFVRVDLRRSGSRLAGSIELPADVSGVFVDGEAEIKLKAGMNRFG